MNPKKLCQSVHPLLRPRSLLLVLLLGPLAPLALMAHAQTPGTKPGTAATGTNVGNATTEIDKQGLDFFEKNVRPVLATRCYGCHNGTAGVTRGGLALDTKDGLRAGGNHGPAIVPGQPDKSLLIKAIGYADTSLQMPPGGKLPDDQVAALRQWVQNGAPDPRVAANTTGKPKLTGLTPQARAHWAFQPIHKPAVPVFRVASSVSGGSGPHSKSSSAGGIIVSPQEKVWIKNPIDAFVLAKLRANGMKPNDPTSRGALIRRATYDLLGLPPTVEEVRAFLSDRSPNAWEKVVDRLLASPHYGERWGRHWLDTARYADTRGYVGNAGRDKIEGYQFPYAWTYRDYVIQSMNDDKPYNQFLLEQIAADKLSDIQTNDPRLAALGFLTVGKRFQNPDDTIDERIDTVTKTTIGLTVACARCHDHKFDPISTADYYSLHGIFSSTIEPLNRPVLALTGDSNQRADFETQLSTLVAQNRDVIYSILRQYEEKFQEHAEGYLMILSRPARGTERYDIAKRYGLLPQDRNIMRNLRPTLLDPVLGPFIQLARMPQADFAQRAPLAINRMVHNRNRAINPIVAQMLSSLRPQTLQDVAKAYGQLFAQARTFTDAYLRERSVTGNRPPNVTASMAEVLETPFVIPPAAALATAEGQIDLFSERTLYKPWQNVLVFENGVDNRMMFAAINNLRLTHPGAPGCAMVVADSPKPHDSYVYIRGERNKRGPVVPRQFLEILSGPDRKLFTNGSGRLELAQAILAPTDPLPARVEVNRLWMYHFGQGFVSTPDDLGNQSEPPSHPELLDWLSSWFMENGWSLKKLHRLILLSSTYQESSATNPAYGNKDPGNRLLWRANLRRLDFEAIRDSMVMLTGKLDETLGGKPVNITDEPYTYRRSCYGYVDRNNLSDLLTQFDFADPDMANTRRISTIVPQQALFFLNSPMSVDVARQVMARPEVSGAKDDDAKVQAVYLILLQRSPKPEEVQWAKEFLTQATSLAGQVPAPAKPTAARQNTGAIRPRPIGKIGNRYATLKNAGVPVDRSPLTGWELYTQALLCSNEFVYVN
jgi:hypothetical protein